MRVVELGQENNFPASMRRFSISIKSLWVYLHQTFKLVLDQKYSGILEMDSAHNRIILSIQNAIEVGIATKEF